MFAIAASRLCVAQPKVHFRRRIVRWFGLVLRSRSMVNNLLADLIHCKSRKIIAKDAGMWQVEREFRTNFYRI